MKLGTSQCSLGTNSEKCQLPAASQNILGRSSCHTVLTFGLSLRLCSFLKLLGEWHVVEEDPRVVKFVVPCPFQVAHAWKQLVQLFVPHEGDDGCIGSGGVGAVRSVVVFVGAPQIAIRLTGCYILKTKSAQPNTDS